MFAQTLEQGAETNVGCGERRLQRQSLAIGRQCAGRIALVLKCNAETQAGLSEGWIYRQGRTQGRNCLGEPPRLEAEKSQVVMNRGVIGRDAAGFLQRENGLRRKPSVKALGRAGQ